MYRILLNSMLDWSRRTQIGINVCGKAAGSALEMWVVAQFVQQFV